jgi:CheY-like chemotaxis protein
MKMRKALIIDDDEFISEILSDILGSGWSCRSVADCSEGCEFVEVIAPDIIFLDISLPFMGGFEVCQILRKRYGNDFSKIVMMSGLSGEDITLQCIAVGANGFLGKPFSTETVMGMVAKMLDVRSDAFHSECVL